ncbi:MAG: serine--tRNA ligase, partial [Terriglobales bacterium]
MIDIQLLRTDLDEIVARLATRGYPFARDAFVSLEAQRKDIQKRTQDLQAARNATAKRIGQAKSKGEDVSALMAEAASANTQLGELEKTLADVQQRLHALLGDVPNLPHESVPVGTTPEDNVEQRRSGTPRRFEFPVKDHVDVGAALGMLDFETAAKLSGARFVAMKGALSRLHRALAQFMLDVHTQEHGYTEVYVPYMVNAACADGVTSLAKFKDDLFKIEGRDLYLIPTAEYPVTNFVREEIVPLESLPMKFACHSPCFRSEAGSAGKDTRGMIRNHQFDKVELVQVVHPTRSYQALE